MWVEHLDDDGAIVKVDFTVEYTDDAKGEAEKHIHVTRGKTKEYKLSNGVKIKARFKKAEEGPAEPTAPNNGVQRTREPAVLLSVTSRARR